MGGLGGWVAELFENMANSAQAEARARAELGNIKDKLQTRMNQISAQTLPSNFNSKLDRSTLKDCKKWWPWGITLGRHSKWFCIHKNLWPGLEALKVGLAENIGASKSGIFYFGQKFGP